MGRPERLIVSMREAREAFRLYQYQQHKANNPHGDVIAEANGRLEQIEWVLKRIDEAQVEQIQVFRAGSDSPGDHDAYARHQRESGTEIETLCESFYYQAFRFRQILDKYLSGFNDHYEPKGVVFVRNHLLEHPKALNPNFMWGSDVPEGPRIKPYGSRSIEFYDPGLYVNAQEMLDELPPSLRAQIDNKGGA